MKLEFRFRPSDVDAILVVSDEEYRSLKRSKGGHWFPASKDALKTYYWLLDTKWLIVTVSEPEENVRIYAVKPEALQK